ncbi:hypothetical protein J3T65_09795, partial [Staphylococcus simiae]
IRKLAAQGAVYFKINNEKDNFYQFSIEIVFFTFTKNLMSQAPYAFYYAVMKCIPLTLLF